MYRCVYAHIRICIANGNAFCLFRCDPWFLDVALSASLFLSVHAYRCVYIRITTCVCSWASVCVIIFVYLFVRVYTWTFTRQMLIPSFSLQSSLCTSSFACVYVFGYRVAKTHRISWDSQDPLGSLIFIGHFPQK